MIADIASFEPGRAATAALRHALSEVDDPTVIDDLLFLERWEMRPLPGTAAVLRVTQLRRANPVLAAAIRAEIAGSPPGRSRSQQ